MDNIVYPDGRARITVPATESIAVFTRGIAQVSREFGYPNLPPTVNNVGTVNNGQTVFGAYSAGATIIIEAGASPVFYEVGVAPLAQERMAAQQQAAPGTLNATGTLTATLLLGGIVTSTTGAAVTATLDTGATMDLAAEFAVNDSFDWSVINTGGNTLTVTASTGHTIVGVAAVVTVTSALFRTRKTAADTFVTYRLA